MSRKKKQNGGRPAETKDKKMKKVAIGLGVVLVALVAFEVPGMLHSGGSSSPTPCRGRHDDRRRSRPRDDRAHP